MKKQLFALLLVSVSFGLTACEEKEDDQIFSAQQCLDKATPATVDTCVNMVAGISSNKAYTIRCSADFIRENITNDKIIDAIENLDNNQSASDPTTILLDNFKFSNITLADAAVNNCTATGAKTLQVLALAAKTATIISSLTGGQSIETWIQTIDPNTLQQQDLENIGNTVIAMQPLACGKGGQFEGNEVCTNLNAAIANGNIDEVAKEFLNQMK